MKTTKEGLRFFYHQLLRCIPLTQVVPLAVTRGGGVAGIEQGTCKCGGCGALTGQGFLQVIRPRQPTQSLSPRFISTTSYNPFISLSIDCISSLTNRYEIPCSSQSGQLGLTRRRKQQRQPPTKPRQRPNQHQSQQHQNQWTQTTHRYVASV